MSAAIDPTVPRELKAGDLSAVFVDGDLREVTWRGSPVAQRIYMATRDRVWNTIPAVIRDVTIEEDSADFSLEFDAVSAYEEIEFQWHGRVQGSAAGLLEYSWFGTAQRDFDYCKIGLNVHHGLVEHLGHGYSIRTEKGEVEGVFGSKIEPQLVKNGTLTAMTPVFDRMSLSVEGATATFEFRGDQFEMQDHRNWADANWKTYGTPLAAGFPMRLAAGERLEQSVRITMVGEGLQPTADDETATAWIEDGAGAALPRLGHRWTRELSDGEMRAVRALRPDHLRVDLHRGELATLAAAAELAREADCSLEIGLFIRPEQLEADVASAARALEAVAVPIDRVLVLQESEGFSEFGGAAPAEMGEAVAMSSIRANVGSVVSGTPQSFNDLNRDRPDYSVIDGLVFALNPQVHASDDTSLMQNTGAIPSIVEFARTQFGDVEVVMSPVDLIGANGPFPAGPTAPAGRKANEDPRQWTSFAAAWTLAAIAEMARSRVTAATFFELTGPRGILDEDEQSPVARVLAQVFEVKGWQLLDTRSSQSARLACLAFRDVARERVFLGNKTAEMMPVHWRGSGTQVVKLSLGPYEVAVLDETGTQL